MMKRLGHFQADKPAADDDGPARLAFVYVGDDAIHVRNVAQGEDVRQFHTGNRRHDRLRALAQDEFVVRHIPLRAGRAFDADGLAGTIDREHLVVHMRMNARPFPKPFRRHHNQLRAVVNFAGDEIRQAAIGKRNIRPALENVNFGCFVHTSRFGSSRCAAGHAAHDDYAPGRLHDFTIRFHGIFASNSPIPQKSVRPAKTSPAPTNAAIPKKPRWTNQPNNTPVSTKVPAAIRT